MNEITTAEELDALPVGSVVRAGGNQDTWVRYRGPYGPRWVGIEYDADDMDMQIEHKQHWLYDALPATVLYNPDAPALTDAALIEEVERRGMSVMDAAEAARLRGRSEALDAVLALCERPNQALVDLGLQEVSPNIFYGETVAWVSPDDIRALLHVDIESEA